MQQTDILYVNIKQNVRLACNMLQQFVECRLVEVGTEMNHNNNMHFVVLLLFSVLVTSSCNILETASP